MNRLETLEQHEASFWAHQRCIIGATKTGIECPRCGAELWQCATELLLTNPPQIPIACRKCKWEGSMH